MQNNFISETFNHEVKKLVFISCACVYPKFAERPFKEDSLFKGELEATSAAFAVAKLAGMKMCEAFNRQYGTNFVSAITTNTFGPNQRYDDFNSWVVPSLIKKLHEAKKIKDKSVVISGSGQAYRDFIFVDDLAAAIILILNSYEDIDFINIGTGIEITIEQLANEIKSIVGFQGEMIFDDTQAEGVVRKLQDISKVKALGWCHKVKLSEGLRISYEDFLKQDIEGGTKCNL